MRIVDDHKLNKVKYGRVVGTMGNGVSPMRDCANVERRERAILK